MASWIRTLGGGSELGHVADTLQVKGVQGRDLAIISNVDQLRFFGLESAKHRSHLWPHLQALQLKQQPDEREREEKKRALPQGSGGEGEEDEDCPENFICPLTQECFVDPVITDDGHTYERREIEQWLRRHNTSPLTNKPLRSTQLRPNHALRSLIAQHKASRKR